MSNEYSITNSGATNTSPGLGGFYHAVTSAANKVYVHVFVAKLPSGYYFHNANNAIGTGGTTQWLTSNAGTGSWKTYAYKVTAGSSAPFSTFGHVYVSTNPRNVWVTGVGATGETGSYTAYLAYSNIFDVTSNNAGIGQLDGSATLTAGWSAKTITIQLDGNEGSGGTASVNITYNTAQGNYPSITLPTRTGYSFNGYWDTSAASGGTQWYNASGNSLRTFNLTANATWWARWSANTYYVYYNQGTATGGWNATTYATQSRTYPNATTLRTNSMTKSNTTANGYTVTYAQGTATGGWNATTYAAQTATNTISYTANGWTTGSTNTNDSDYANGASFGSSSTTNLTLYPNFTTSTSYGGVTTRTNSMTKSNTALGTVTFKYQDGSTADTTSAGYTSYTANGWTTTSGSTSRTYANGAATGALSGNVTLYPCFSQSTTSASFPSPTRSGYTFDGWYDAASGGNKVTSYTGTTAKTLYAHWTALALTMNAPTPTGTSATGTGTTTTSGFMVGATVTFTCSGQSGNYPKTLQISGQTAVSNSSNASSISATYTISSPSTSFTISATCTGAVGNTKTVTSVAKPIYRKFQLLYEKNGASAIGSTSSSVQTLAANSTSGDGGTTFTLPSSITCVNNGRSCTSSGWDLETAKVCPRFAKGAKVNVCTTNTSGCSGTAAKSSAVPGSCAAAGSTGTIQLGEEYTARYVYAISYSTFNNPTKLSTAVTVPSSVTSTKNDGNIYIYGSFTPSNVSITMTNRCYNRSDGKKIFALNGGGGTNNVATICSASQSSCAKAASTDIFKSNYSFGCMSSAGGSSFVQL